MVAALVGLLALVIALVGVISSSSSSQKHTNFKSTLRLPQGGRKAYLSTVACPPQISHRGGQKGEPVDV